MMRTWPTGSGRRCRSARDSGTNSAVRTTAAIPTGMLTQKMPRQPTESTSAPPTIGPSAMLMPKTPPHTPIARARAAQQRAEREQRQARLEGAPAADAVRGRPGEQQQAREHQRVRVDRPLQAGDGRAQLTPDRRQRDVHDRAVQADDEQAQAADAEHEQAALAAEFRQIGSPRWSRGNPATLVLARLLLVNN